MDLLIPAIAFYFLLAYSFDSFILMRKRWTGRDTKRKIAGWSALSIPVIVAVLKIFFNADFRNFIWSATTAALVAMFASVAFYLIRRKEHRGALEFRENRQRENRQQQSARATKTRASVAANESSAEEFADDQAPQTNSSNTPARQASRSKQMVTPSQPGKSSYSDEKVDHIL